MMEDFQLIIGNPGNINEEIEEYNHTDSDEDITIEELEKLGIERIFGTNKQNPNSMKKSK